MKHENKTMKFPFTCQFLKFTLTNCKSAKDLPSEKTKPSVIFGAQVFGRQRAHSPPVGGRCRQECNAAAGAWCCARAASNWHPAQTCVLFNFLLSDDCLRLRLHFLKKKKKKIIDLRVLYKKKREKRKKSTFKGTNRNPSVANRFSCQAWDTRRGSCRTIYWWW